ncbi:MAG: D-alanyl-D-alanine carboxypeptidase family protein [Eubacteriales bacterium]|nr:D-alanyl-D-alanine carboxypeptidase family protein [Eubacteriales bacterium]
MIKAFKKIKRVLVGALVICMLISGTAFAQGSWPVMNSEIKAVTAIVMDADTGTILWGREVHSKRYPASITKLLTALIVIEECNLNDTVTFSKTAVSNLESGAVTIGCKEGDTLTVRECLEALLLKSANEVANGLAEHVSGSIEAFAERMNERARELGCLNSNFRNPSGLTDSEHVTTAYDMALIGARIMKEPVFLEIEAEETAKIGPTTGHPNGITVTIGHQMIKSGTEYTDERVIGGKTGFTSAAGNTLVTCATEKGRNLVVVCLKDQKPYHYTDTEALLNFGFFNFERVIPDGDELIKSLRITEELVLDKAVKENEAILKFLEDPKLILPVGASTDDLKCEFEYGKGPGIAHVNFKYCDRLVGEGDLENIYEQTIGIEETLETQKEDRVEQKAGIDLGRVILFTLLGLAASLIVLVILYFVKRRMDEKKRRERFKRRREERLREEREYRKLHSEDF